MKLFKDLKVDSTVVFSPRSSMATLLLEEDKGGVTVSLCRPRWLYQRPSQGVPLGGPTLPVPSRSPYNSPVFITTRLQLAGSPDSSVNRGSREPLGTVAVRTSVHHIFPEGRSATGTTVHHSACNFTQDSSGCTTGQLDLSAHISHI